MRPLIIFNGRFIDFTAENQKIKALFIDRHEIQKVYHNARHLPAGIKRFDLKGRYLLPGFTDCHTHLISRGLERQRIDLAATRTLDSCLRKIAANKDEYDIVFAQNYDDTDWSTSEKRGLTRKTLDRITKKPVIMRRVCGHYAVVNTAALKILPKEWRYIESESGRLYENAALFLNDVFRPDQTTLIKAIELGMQEAAKNGVTTVHEISDPERIGLLLKIKRASRLKTRFVLYVLEKYAGALLDAGITTAWGDDFVKFAGIKIWLDGSLGARTAAISKPYAQSRNHGRLLISLARLKHLVKKAEQQGIQLMMHAIGDRAIDLGLRAVESGSRRKNPCRHRFEHLELLNRRLIDRLTRADIIASMQPNFVRRWQNPGGLYHRNLGRRYLGMNPFNELRRAGIHLVFGSDNMPLGPIFGLKGATRHPSTRNRLSISHALAGYTTRPAYAAFEENRKGGFRPGMLADFVVLDQNPEKIKDTDDLKIDFVILGGDIIYRRCKTSEH